MRSFQYTAHVLWALSLMVVMSVAGCTKPTPPPTATGPAVTTGPAITTPPAPLVETTVEDVVEDAVEETVGDLPGPSVEPDVMEAVTTPVEPNEPVDIVEPPEPITPAALGNLVAIDIQLPAPAFRGTPVPLDEPNVAKPLGKPRGPFLAPEGTINLAVGKPVVCSDPAPPSGETDFVTDGNKEASDFAYLELRPGHEWVQIDLGEKATIYAVLLWHNHADARVYRDVIVEVSDDPDFLDSDVVFNNDYDNSSGMRVGPDMGYVETSEGKLIDCRGVEGRYVRLHSNGSTLDAKNHYTEVEVFGKPAG
ncbi:MAG TPA: discoidin domain-containing protein [Thermoguttaceae bacterium]|nr:discoidin domain-containing protein [Thermoguttaceae bacterium]